MLLATSEASYTFNIVFCLLKRQLNNDGPTNLPMPASSRRKHKLHATKTVT